MSSQPVSGALATAPPAQVEDALAEQALDWLQVNVLKLVATRVVPLIFASGIVTAGLAWVEDVVGIDLPASALATICFTMLAGVVAVAFAYVKNHSGAAKLGAALLELKKIEALGTAATRELGGLPMPSRPE